MQIILTILLAVVLAAEARSSTMNLNDEIYIAKAMAEGRKYITVLFAANNGMQGQFINELEKSGGYLQYGASDIGYYRAKVPTDKVFLIAQSEAVAAIAVHEYLPVINNQKLRHRITAEGNKEKKIDIIKLFDFLSSDSRNGAFYETKIPLRRNAREPYFDGRGAKIAIIEMFADPSAPELQDALDIKGNTIRKVSGIYAVYNTDVERGESSSYTAFGAVKLSKISAVNDNINSEARAFTFPLANDLEFGLLDETKLTLFDKDLNKDGKLERDYRRFGVARSITAGCIWIDTDQDRDFTDEHCMKDYGLYGQTGVFKTSSPELSGARFHIVTSRENDSIVVGVAFDHTHSVAAVAAGTPVDGAPIGGVAPGAQVALYSVGPALDNIIEAIIDASRDFSVDVILTMMGAKNNINDGNHLINIIIDRAASKYNKVFVTPAGNNIQRLNGVEDQGAGSRVLSVGQYHGKTMSEYFKGGERVAAPGIYSSAGPASDGALKPDVIMPSLAITPYPVYLGKNDSNNFICPGLNLPSDLVCFSGTSASAPAAAGAAAVLISAARQVGVSVREDEVRRAIMKSAQLIEGFPVNVQGRGLVNIEEAWRYLHSVSNKRERMSDFIVKVPIKDGRDSSLVAPAYGRGLYEREGWHAGSKDIRYIKVRRTKGASDDVVYRLEILGDYNNTYRVRKEMTLRLDEEVELPIWISPSKPGVHSAILRIHSSMDRDNFTDVGLTVVAARSGPGKARHQDNLSVKINGVEARKIYFNVDKSANLLNIVDRSAEGKNIDFKLFGPLGGRGQKKIVSENDIWSEKKTRGRRKEISVFFPEEGTWELIVFPSDISNLDAKNSVNVDFQLLIDYEREDNPKKNGFLSSIVDDSDKKQRENIQKQIALIKNGVIKKRFGPDVVYLGEGELVNNLVIAAKNTNVMSDTGTVFVVIFRCKERNCSVYKATGGRGETKVAVSMVDDVTKSDKWFAAFLSRHTGEADTILEYSVFQVL